MLRALACAAVAALVACACPAQATVRFDFTVFYTQLPGFNYGLPPELSGSFELADTPTVVDDPDYQHTVILNPIVTWSNGRVETAELHFYDAAFEGGFDIFPSSQFFFSFSLGTPVLFSGSLDAPIFNILGSYDVPDYMVPEHLRYSLTITHIDDAGAVPEPVSWAMMIIGFGMVGGTLRLQRRGGRARMALA